MAENHDNTTDAGWFDSLGPTRSLNDAWMARAERLIIIALLFAIVLKQNIFPNSTAMVFVGGALSAVLVVASVVLAIHNGE